MSITNTFTKALKRNIESTYTYAYVKNMGVSVSLNTYDPFDYFESYVQKEPFKAFMALERYAFRNTKRALDKYNIPYTKEQERRAKVFTDVTERMQQEKSDVVIMPEITDIADTGIVRTSEGLTTEDTIESHEILNRLPRNKQTDNVLYESKLPKTLRDSKEQMAAIKNSLTNHISVLIGGAGTGKSFVTANIIDQLKQNGKKVTILAPTHKAKDALQQKLNDGTVRTIHSFVHSNTADTSDVIVVDEAGMLSTPLFLSLIKKRFKKTEHYYEGETRSRYSLRQIIFVGDKNQLAPIEYGRPFEKAMKLFPCFELKQNRRSESPDIVALGRAVIDEPYNKNISFDNVIEVSSTNEAFKLGAEVVLTFTNNEVKEINNSKKIKNGVPAISPLFSVGDSIIAKTNERNYYNGQLFEIVDRNLIQSQNGNQIKIKDARELEYNFDFAYGLTIHKSQGSEWETVAYMPSAYDTRNLAYVAITRARKKLILIGELNGNLNKDKEWYQLN